MFSSYRNQSVDLQSKSTDWFLYDWNIVREKVKDKPKFMSQQSLYSRSFCFHTWEDLCSLAS